MTEPVARATSQLSLESLGHLRYLHKVLTQPTGSWEGFYAARSASMNFALRYQLAFSAYALALISTHTPAYRAPYAEAIGAAVEKMLHPDVWSYWRAPQEAGASTSGHVAVLVSPHQQMPAGPPSDPIAHDNLQYSGHLSTMLGLYEKVSGDTRYDLPFTLSDPTSGVSYTYTYGEVAERIHSQMRENRFGGVCCEPGMAYVPCNNYAMASNTLHDALHGTRYSRANAGWLSTVRDKMLLHGPSVRGVFGASYVKDLKVATPIAFNFTDAWGLATLIPFDRDLVKKLYPKFRRKVERDGERAYVGSSPFNERLEISDVSINTGFGLILARGIGDRKLAEALDRYAREEFGAGWEGTNYFYRNAPRTLYSTALYAFAEALPLGGANFTRLFTAPPDPSSTAPYLSRVKDASGRIGVCRAEYSEKRRTLYIGLQQIGESASSAQVELFIGNITADARVEVSTSSPEAPLEWHENTTAHLAVTVAPRGVTECVIRLP